MGPSFCEKAANIPYVAFIPPSNFHRFVIVLCITKTAIHFFQSWIINWIFVDFNELMNLKIKEIMVAFFDNLLFFSIFGFICMLISDYFSIQNRITIKGIRYFST